MNAIINSPRLLHRFHDANLLADAVIVDRTTQWGNPFVFGPGTGRTRIEAVRLFEEYAVFRHRNEPTWLAPLAGRNLVCCHLTPCHAETLLRLANP